MPYLLIILTLIFASCKSKKINTLSEPGFKGALEQRTFITVKHNEGESVMRSKILNSFVEEKIPSENNSNQINNRDELIGYKMDNRDMERYAEKEKSMAKVIVSYTDRLEIYYLPENVPFDVIAAKLGLNHEADRVFKWSKSPYTKTVIGTNFYLASVNIEDVVKNDQNFFQESIQFKNEFAGKSIRLSSGKLLEFQISHTTYLQTEVAQNYQSTVKCNRDTQESGSCGICKYVRNVPGGSYNKTENLSVENLGLSVKIGDRIYNVSQFQPVAGKDSFKINVDAMEYELKKEVDVELISNGVAGITKYAANYGHNGYCPETSGGAEINLARSVNAEVIVHVKGRGAEILKNIL